MENTPTNSSEVAGTRVRDSITTFVEDSGVNVSQTAMPSAIARDYYSGTSGDTPQDIKTFLGIPRVIQNGNLSITDTSTSFSPIRCPVDILSSNIFRDKIKGYYGMRFKMVFTLNVNAERFQQGRYRLCYVPLGGTAQTNDIDLWVNQHSATLVQRSNLPGVDIDLNCDTTAVLEIPFSMAADFYMLNSTYNEAVGMLRLFPYSVMESVSGSTSCSYTLWAHFEEVELIGRVVPFELQAPRFRSSIKKKNQNASELEAEKSGVGPISSVAFQISRAAKYFNPVPVLGDYSSKLAWASDIIGNSASVFGWSSPANLAPSVQVMRSRLYGATNVNKADYTPPMSLQSDNQVDVLPGAFGTDKDELDISNFVSIPTYYNKFTMDTSDLVNDIIADIKVTPVIGNLSVDGVHNRLDTGPMGYLSRKFTYWRGGITYKFKIVKTEFHSGRIAVWFMPDKNNSVAANNTVNSSYTNRTIIDLREHSEFTITVPYIHETPYMDYNYSTGRLKMGIIDKLVAPSTVPSAIHFIVEISGAPDLEFAVPLTTPFVYPSSVTLQSPLSESHTCEIFSGNVGNMSDTKFQVSTASAAIGEKIINLRTLLKKYHPLGFNIDAKPSGSTIILRPFSTDVVPPGTNTTAWNDLYGDLNGMFMFSRGGVRFKSVPDATISGNWVAYMSYIHGGTYASPLAQNSSADTQPLSKELNSGNYVFAPMDQNSSIEFTIPQYNKTHSRTGIKHMSGSSRSILGREPGATQTVVRITEAIDSPGSRGTISPVFLRAGADDVNFGLFVSIPPLYYT